MLLEGSRCCPRARAPPAGERGAGKRPAEQGALATAGGASAPAAAGGRGKSTESGKERRAVEGYGYHALLPESRATLVEWWDNDVGW